MEYIKEYAELLNSNKKKSSKKILTEGLSSAGPIIEKLKDAIKNLSAASKSLEEAQHLNMQPLYYNEDGYDIDPITDISDLIDALNHTVEEVKNGIPDFYDESAKLDKNSESSFEIDSWPFSSRGEQDAASASDSISQYVLSKLKLTEEFANSSNVEIEESDEFMEAVSECTYAYLEGIKSSLPVAME
jgi:hypothetical protein